MSLNRHSETDAELAARLQREEDRQQAFQQQQQINQDEEFARRLANLHEEKSSPAISNSFKPTDIEKINAHFASLSARANGQYQQNLMGAVLEDDSIKLEFVANPVFIRGDGQIIDRDTAMELLRDKLPSPKTNEPFEEKDIIPCNAIILAMWELLDIINKNISDKVLLVKDLASKPHYTKYSEQEINFIEQYYETLPPQHKRLFNFICRSRGGYLLEDPVLLPDGHIYEKSVVNNWIEASEAKREICYCPQSNIPVTKDDLTVCYFSRSVLQQIKENMQKLMNAQVKPSKPNFFANKNPVSEVKEQKSQVIIPEAKAPSHVKVELTDTADRERKKLITEIHNLMISLGFEPKPSRHNFLMDGSLVFFGLLLSAFQTDPYAIPLSNLNTKNDDMHQMLLAAITALETLDASQLKTAIAQHGNAFKVKTIAGSLFGRTSSLRSSGYAKFANSMGSVKHQPGWYVNNIIKKVEVAIPRLLIERDFYNRLRY